MRGAARRRRPGRCPLRLPPSWRAWRPEEGACEDVATASASPEAQAITLALMLCTAFRSTVPFEDGVCADKAAANQVEHHAHAVAVGSFVNVWSIAQTGHLRRGTESSPSRAP